MKLDAFLDDVLGLEQPHGWSRRQQCAQLVTLLEQGGSKANFYTVWNWFFRKSIPGPWLMKIIGAAQKAGRTIDLNNYQEEEGESLDHN